MLDGRKLIELPPKAHFDPEHQFSKEESDIYNFLQARSRVRTEPIPYARGARLTNNWQAVFNKFLRQGTVLKNYSHVLVMLLRLRQCCVHPALIGKRLGTLPFPYLIIGGFSAIRGCILEEGGSTGHWRCEYA